MVVHWRRNFLDLLEQDLSSWELPVRWWSLGCILKLMCIKNLLPWRITLERMEINLRNNCFIYDGQKNRKIKHLLTYFLTGGQLTFSSQEHVKSTSMDPDLSCVIINHLLSTVSSSCLWKYCSIHKPAVVLKKSWIVTEKIIWIFASWHPSRR